MAMYRTLPTLPDTDVSEPLLGLDGKNSQEGFGSPVRSDDGPQGQGCIWKRWSTRCRRAKGCCGKKMTLEKRQKRMYRRLGVLMFANVLMAFISVLQLTQSGSLHGCAMRKYGIKKFNSDYASLALITLGTSVVSFVVASVTRCVTKKTLADSVPLPRPIPALALFLTMINYPAAVASHFLDEQQAAKMTENMANLLLASKVATGFALISALGFVFSSCRYYKYSRREAVLSEQLQEGPIALGDLERDEKAVESRA
ncbi:hypothetical protein BDN72DRAFT_839354 [Pluteus cervinus]|uniref:Uncharacterized protein n=1 Tax=Pluteus cervinus TaxID=181527 RepID=A0ACD3AYA5_9AGAR|nr:hypothetical protein BDN72DRAFT_839354 [Pluteus cervinus]